jgi:hypothetical protein
MDLERLHGLISVPPLLRDVAVTQLRRESRQTESAGRLVALAC